MIREYNIFDEKGELLSSNVSRMPPKIKGRWFFVNSKSMIKILGDFDSLVSMKIVWLLGSKMTFESNWIKISKVDISLKLGCSYVSVDKGIKDLKNKNLLIEGKVDGVSAFMLNPDLICKGGKNRTEHLKEWNYERSKDEEVVKVIDVDVETGEIVGERVEENFNEVD